MKLTFSSICHLSFIPSTPSLASITISYRWWELVGRVDPDEWTETDRCLTRISKTTNVKSGLVLVLRRWQSEKLVWEGFSQRLEMRSRRSPMGWSSFETLKTSRRSKVLNYSPVHVHDFN